MKNFESINLDFDTENSENNEDVLSAEDIAIELEKFQKESESLLKLHKSALESFSDSVIPELKFSNGVLINFKTMTVHLDTKFFFDRKFNQRQMIWAAYHELAHFRDFISDPRRFMENFEHIKSKSEEYGKKIRDVLGREKADENDPCDEKAYDAWHTFYNCLDDVYVNSLVARGVPFVYGAQGRSRDDVSGLYEEVLFRDSDYSALSRNRQFSYAILRKAMLPDQEIVFSEEMADIFEREIDWAGKKIKVIDFIEKIKSQNRAGVKAGDRYFMIKKTLEPIFEELYQKDLSEWEEQQNQKQEQQNEQQDLEDETESESSRNDTQDNQGEDSEPTNDENQEESQGGAPKNLDDEFNPDSESGKNQKPELLPDFDPNNGDLDPEKIEDILDQIEKYKKGEKDKSEKPKSSKNFEQIAKERQEKQERDWCKENNIEYRVYKSFEETKAEIEPYLRALSELWENIIYGTGKDVQRSTMPANIGEINIDRAIKYYSDIVSGRFDEMKVMDKKTKEVLPSNKPEFIKIRFVGDASNSVAIDTEKIKIMQQVYVLIMTSLRDFETKLNRTRNQTRTKLSVHTEGWVFGNQAKKIKSVRSGRDYVSEQAEIIRQFSFIGRDLGFTYDNTAFAGIKDELSDRDVQSIKSGKTMDLVFEVTDGGSSNGAETKKLVDELEQKGLILRAFQIGKTNKSEDAVFNNVWNEGQKSPRGFKIGTEMKNVIPAIVASLKQYLGDVKI